MGATETRAGFGDVFAPRWLACRFSLRSRVRLRPNDPPSHKLAPPPFAPSIRGSRKALTSPTGSQTASMDTETGTSAHSSPMPTPRSYGAPVHARASAGVDGTGAHAGTGWKGVRIQAGREGLDAQRHRPCRDRGHLRDRGREAQPARSGQAVGVHRGLAIPGAVARAPEAGPRAARIAERAVSAGRCAMVAPAKSRRGGRAQDRIPQHVHCLSRQLEQRHGLHG